MGQLHQEKGAKQAKGNGFDVGEMIETAERAQLKRLRDYRDAVDAGVPKVLSLTQKERTELADKAASLYFAVGSLGGWMAYMTQFTDSSAPKYSLAQRRRESLAGSVASQLRVAAENPPKDKKAYQDSLDKAWAEAKAAVNEILNPPPLPTIPKKP